MSSSPALRLDSASDGVTTFIPDSAVAYTQLEYWQARFSREANYEWLAGFAALRAHVRPHLERLRPAAEARVLLVGTGNSPLAEDLEKDGFHCVTATDYSSEVIARMAARCAQLPPPVSGIKWAVADMRDLRGIADGSCDAVVDKAAMDAVLADGGDAWPGQAPPHLMETARAIVEAAARVLAPGGVYLQLTFAQPQFRRQYLSQAPAQWSSLQCTSLDIGLGLSLWVAIRA